MNDELDGGLEYHLEREIRLSEESEYKSLYSWSLQEFDSGGNKIGDKQVPWQWRLYFTASELQYHRSIEIGQSFSIEDEKVVEEKKPVEEAESITAILHPGACCDGKWWQDDPTFSMFGTDRKISHFGLNINKLDDGDTNERCNLWGCVSYDYECDFVNETTDDNVEIYLWLSPQRFNNLAEIIKTQTVDKVQVSLCTVFGFYSEWSPSISTDSIKILANSDDQKIVRPEGCDITPPQLGQVGEFNLSMVKRCKLNPKQDFRSINIYKLFGEEEEIVEDNLVDDFAETEPDTNAVLLAQLARNEAAAKKIRTPLWFIFILLLLLFLTQV